MDMVVVRDGWLISRVHRFGGLCKKPLIKASEAETMTAAELEQAQLQRAWDELQSVPSYVERFSTFPASSPDSKLKEE